MRFSLNTSSIADYEKFIRARQCPVYEVRGTDLIVPDEYTNRIVGGEQFDLRVPDYEPSKFLFDYQRDIAGLAIRKKKFGVFVEPGYGKTLIMMEFAIYADSIADGRPVLIVSPINVIPQTVEEAERFYPGIQIQRVPAAKLQDFLDNGHGIGITNYESFNQDLRAGKLFALLVDESSMLKSHYGRWGTAIIDLGAGLEYALPLTGTPAPNDRIEYANHAVFCGACRTVNEFLARYFINRGQTSNRWELKDHALDAFYRDMSHWCMFMVNPASYGWKDNAATIPPINVHIHRVELTEEQKRATRDTTGTLFVGNTGGIGQRSKLGQIAKGYFNGESIGTNKPKFIADLCQSFGKESAIIWCKYNDEQEKVAAALPGCANITGSTPIEERLELIQAFKLGQIQHLVSKGKILGFGLNLQIATRHVFSTLEDSYETYWQCVKRSNRVGSTVPLNVHLPLTENEEPMAQNALTKCRRVQQDTEDQERRFKENAWIRF